MEVVLPLPGLHLRLRLDKVSPEAQALLLYDLVYLPLLGIVNAVQQSGGGSLQAVRHVGLRMSGLKVLYLTPCSCYLLGN